MAGGSAAAVATATGTTTGTSGDGSAGMLDTIASIWAWRVCQRFSVDSSRFATSQRTAPHDKILTESSDLLLSWKWGS